MLENGSVIAKNYTVGAQRRLPIGAATENGQNVVQGYALGSKQRLTVYVNNFIPSTSVSTQVSSDQPIVVERTMKFASRQGIHRTLGARQ